VLARSFLLSRSAGRIGSKRYHCRRGPGLGKSGLMRLGFQSLLAQSERLELPLNFLELFIAAVLEVYELISGGVQATQYFVQLEVQSARVADLGVLNQEHHQER